MEDSEDPNLPQPSNGDRPRRVHQTVTLACIVIKYTQLRALGVLHADMQVPPGATPTEPEQFKPTVAAYEHIVEKRTAHIESVLPARDWMAAHRRAHPDGPLEVPAVRLRKLLKAKKERNPLPPQDAKYDANDCRMDQLPLINYCLQASVDAFRAAAMEFRQELLARGDDPEAEAAPPEDVPRLLSEVEVWAIRQQGQRTIAARASTTGRAA